MRPREPHESRERDATVESGDAPRPLRLGITLGDPRGIGPEIAREAAAWVTRELPGTVLRGFGPGGDSDAFDSYTVVGAWDGSERSAGAVSLAAIREAVSRALDGELDAIVTAPVHKPALREAGCAHAGHTELLAELTGAAEVGMLMVARETLGGGPLRVLLATTHLAFRDVPGAITADLLVGQTRLLDRHLRRHWDLDRPRLALCALNPHASDGGLFGDEESRVYGPALARLRSEGLVASGPFPADTVFTRALRGEFDAVVAPYHDVGMAAFKTACFGRGVNVTLGLPFVRTSPDHGTAFDIAGRGSADPTSMFEAVRLAARFAGAAS